MATIQQLRELYGGSSDFETIDLASKDLGLSPMEIADELGMGSRGGKNAQRMSASVDRYQAGLYGTGEALAGAAGLTGVQNWMRSGRVANETEANIASERARNMGAVDSFKDVHSLGDFGDYAVGLGIQSLPYMGEAIVGGMTGGATAARIGLQGAGAVNAARATGAAVASYPSSVGDILQNQREQSGGQTDLLSAAGLAVPYAAANAIGVEGALARGQLFRNSVGALDNINGVRGGLARAGVTAGRTAMTEGASETFQEGMNQFGRMAVDPTEAFFNPQSNERFMESFVGGATLGGMTGGGLGGWRRSEAYVDPQQPASLLPDAPAPGLYNPPESLTNTGVTELPGFSSRQQDPLQQVINAPPPGPSVEINPNAPNERAVANGTATPQQTKAAQVSPEERQGAAEKYRMETVLDDGTEEGHWRLFGRDFFHRADLNKALDRQAVEDRNVDPGLSSFAKELNAATTPFIRPQNLNELARNLYGSTPEKTAYNLNAAIAGGHKEAERLAATYEKLTGKEAPAWQAAQQAQQKPQPTAAPKPVVAPTAPAAPTAPQTFEEDDFDGMARATLMKLFNNNERSVEIALADLRGDKPADIQKAYGVSDSLVRKIRDAYTAPKRLELAAKQAGVPLEALQAALAKRAETATQDGAVFVEDEEGGEKPLSSDDRPLAQAADEELTGEQAESDAFANGMSIRTDSGSQIADVGGRNTSRSKFEKAKQNLQSRSLTLADLNNLYEEFINEESDAGDALAQKVVAEVERRHKYKLFDDVEQGEVDKAVTEGKGKKDETRNAVLPAGQENARASTRKGSAAPAAGKANGAKKSEGPVADAWDKMASQVKKAGLDLPTWDKLSPEQQIKAQDKYVLNGKLDMREAQKVLSAKEIGGLPPKRPAPDLPAHGMYAGEKSAAKFVDRHRNFLTARKMIESAEDPEKVRLATGWFRGPHDKKWRYEIADNEASLNAWDKVEESKLFDKPTEYPLNIVLKHPKLYEAYPEARQIKVVKQPGFLDFGGLQGWFNDEKNVIGITPYAKDPLSTLLHEVQHWIQRQEGYATGGNENMVFEAMTPEQKKRIAARIIPKLEERSNRLAEDVKAYRLAKKIAAWPELQAVKDANDQWRAARDAFDHAEKTNAPAPYKEVVADAKDKALENFTAAEKTLKFRVAEEFGIKPTPWFKGSTVMQVELEQWQRLAIIYAQTADSIDKALKVKEEDAIENQKMLAGLRSGDETVLKEAITKSGQGFELYRAIAGEIEARDTQFRQQMTDEERKKNAPFTGEKFDPDDVIVTFGDKKSTSREAQAPLIELRKRESVLKSLLTCLG